MPYVGDSKRAMDEYTSEIFMGGKNTIVMHNTCEDSLLAAPIILDLVLLAELSSRIQFKAEGEVCLPALIASFAVHQAFTPYCVHNSCLLFFIRASSIPSIQLQPFSVTSLRLLW